MRAVVGRRCQLRDAEVEDLDALVFGDEQVLRLHVTMNDALVMRGGKAVGHLARVLECFAHRQGTSCETTPERFALEQFGHDVRSTAVRADVMNRENVRVVEASDRACLLLEPRQAIGVGCERFRNQFDGDVT
jgi:hypothetical protein